ncbi:Phage terminase-like protein, large subunit, contains N-terminal HTH domain [Micromonospora pallida]|uniref:Phage terminase-like protein, large subunit, contains N-terminal HTH domain n=1 Tax=Micromonospora pallida TaxID=145854 RepID=A0A1C6TNK8_9ACTN|nr:terminase [Micromonospora pallida]SCL43177.1 Phage terminase-like protein, large subunit, contains N-terminal HTH domain [Micromonospora pallida]
MQRTKTRSTARPDPYEPYPVRLWPGMSRAEIYAAYGLTCPPRIGTLRDPSRKTYGTSIARISAQLGMPMMPAQRYSVDVALEVDPGTQALAYRDVTLLKPRQSGKTSIVLGVKSHRALAFTKEAKRHAPQQVGRQRILYAAQKRQDAREKLIDDHLPILERSPLASRFRVRLRGGLEALLWDTGAIDGITANTEDAAHGKTLDLGVEDEFFHAEDSRLEQAFSPAMLTRWSPQHWRVSTEGTEKSTYLAAKVELGRQVAESGQQHTICYLEWSNLDDPHDDPQTWLSCMPALCPIEGGPCVCGVDEHGRQWWRHTVTVETIRAELAKATTVEDFERAYLNRRRGSKPPADPNMPPLARWNELVDPLGDELRPDPDRPLAMGIEADWQGTQAAIVAAWIGADERRYLRVIEYRPGIDWVPGRARDLNETWKPVGWGVDVGGGPAKQLKDPLAENGLVLPSGEPERGQIASPTVQDAAAYTAVLLNRVRVGTLRHAGQDSLTKAWKVARTKPVGDSFVLDRKAGNIVTLNAARQALYALETRKHLAVDDDYDVADSFG